GSLYRLVPHPESDRSEEVRDARARVPVVCGLWRADRRAPGLLLGGVRRRPLPERAADQGTRGGGPDRPRATATGIRSLVDARGLRAVHGGSLLMTTVVHFDPEFSERPLCGEADQGLSFLTWCREMVSCAHCTEAAVARDDR